MLALALTVTGSWGPSMWADELATAQTTASWDTLWNTIQTRDAVFLPYYLLMYVWSRAGAADWWLRLPSALAVAAATVLLADLGRRLGGARAGTVAGVTLLLLPAISRFGQEARPYTMAVAAAVLSFWCLHRALETGRWAGYVVSVMLLPCTHLFAVLCLPAHLVISRRCLPWLALGSPITLAVAAASAGQVGQVNWLKAPGWEHIVPFRSAITGWQSQPEPGNLPAVLLGWAVALTGLASAAVLLRRGAPPPRRFIAGLVVWGVLPTPVLVAVSHLATPVYSSRYVLFAAPAFALLAGLGAARVPRTVLVAALGVAVALGARQQVLLRTEPGHQMSYRAAAEIVSAQRRTGDQIVYLVPWARQGLARYGTMPPERRAGQAAGERVWLVRNQFGRAIRPGTGLPSRDGVAPAMAAKIDTLLAERFTVTRTWPLRGVSLLLLERPPPASR
ncbi:hypothetical protein Sru01_58760 [Sphaerisporangium rufum]|uniref:Glycosyltransferase RgtA/B/C/D-like domain-containing protein n=1 Tax=Sphaerisporangium rufum TaxID=1381558 RepID=A0A919V2M7_9ACTN|nr:glycosyltransferase family 39 protein [Sphaerisporangium rufum]GII80894.1 hypothetical protein Sru01_58760 [Sphaerisporangium rufum]